MVAFETERKPFDVPAVIQADTTLVESTLVRPHDGQHSAGSAGRVGPVARVGARAVGSMQLVHPCAPTAARMLARGSTRRRHRWGVGSKVGSQEMCVTVRFARNSRGRPHVVLGARAAGGTTALPFFALRSCSGPYTCCSSPQGDHLSKRRLEGGAHRTRRARAAMRRGDRGGGAMSGHSVFSH